MFHHREQETHQTPKLLRDDEIVTLRSIQFAMTYDAWYRTPFGRYADQLETSLILKLLPEVNRKRILDVGCGTGNYSFMLARRGASVVGADTSLPMIKVAKEQSKKLQSHLEVVLADANALPFRSGVYDLSISVLALCFIRTPRDVVKEMRRVTKQEGALVLATLNKWSLYGVSKRIRSLFIESSYRSAIFHTPFELKSLVESAEWHSTIFALEWMPEWLLQILYRIDAALGRMLKPFGAFLATKAVTSAPTLTATRYMG